MWSNSQTFNQKSGSHGQLTQEKTISLTCEANKVWSFCFVVFTCCLGTSKSETDENRLYFRQGTLSRRPSDELLLLVEGWDWGRLVWGLDAVPGVETADACSPPPSGDSTSFSSHCIRTSRSYRHKTTVIRSIQPCAYSQMKIQISMHLMAKKIKSGLYRQLT